MIFERGNVSVRDREKVMRGMNTRESAQKIIDAMRIHYNFCREHSRLGKTPTEACGIKIEGENKLLTLIQNSIETYSSSDSSCLHNARYCLNLFSSSSSGNASNISLRSFNIISL